MNLSAEIAELKRQKDERFKLQLKVLKRQKEVKWKKNNHDLFPTKDALKPSDRQKNDIDFD